MVAFVSGQSDACLKIFGFTGALIEYKVSCLRSLRDGDEQTTSQFFVISYHGLVTEEAQNRRFSSVAVYTSLILFAE